MPVVPVQSGARRMGWPEPPYSQAPAWKACTHHQGYHWQGMT